MSDTIYVLVELENPKGSQDNKIMRVIRTYLSYPRAEEDITLLMDACPNCYFDAIESEYIDN